MADSPEPEPDTEPRQPASDNVRWPALFQRAHEAIFLLNRQRRVFFVNRAWEELTGLAAAQVRGRLCKRHREPAPDSWEALANGLALPPEVLAGQPSRIRRLLPSAGGVRRWCDLDFFPVRDNKGIRAVLGKITPLAEPLPLATGPLPEEVLTLRAAHAQHYRLEYLASSQAAGSAPLRQVVDQARLASQTRVPVLVVGEPGTGKQWLARAIHYQSAAREAGFVSLDCAHLPAGVLAGLLFGDGGLMWQPNVATLYLREPSRLPGDLQERLGDLVAEANPRGPRIIAGVCCPSGTRGQPPAGDLHCALGTLRLELPPLRDRPAADLPWLVERLLQRVRGSGGVGKPTPSATPAPSASPIPGLTPEAWELLYTYRWPGNVRELAAVLASAAAHASVNGEGSRIDVADLPTYMRLGGTAGPPSSRLLPLDHLLEQAERRLIALALRKARGNKSRTAEILSIWRPRLLRRMEVLGIQGGGQDKEGRTKDER